MIYKYNNKVFNILLIIALLFSSSFIHANTHESLHITNELLSKLDSDQQMPETYEAEDAVYYDDFSTEETTQLQVEAAPDLQEKPNDDIRPLPKYVYDEKFLREVQINTTEYSNVFEEHSQPSITKFPSEIEFQKSSIVVGLLKTEEETYPYELGLSQNMYEIFNNFGVKTVLIDYNKIINLKEIQEESLSLAQQDEMLARKLTLDRIKIEVAKFVEEQKINRIFISGNYYNLYSEPFPPTPCHQLVTEGIVKIVDDNPSIHLLGICGGLQGIMNAKGIEVVHVANMVNDEEEQKFYLKYAPNPQKECVPLQQIKIVPNSRLAEVAAKFLIPDENGWLSTCFPDAHSGALNNTPENRSKLESLGYKIVAFSSDGVIEAIEDKHGNVHFQNHLEALVVKSDKTIYLSNQKEHQVSRLVAIAIINDFLYRVNEG